MGRLVLGVVAATLAVYFWGFLYWGLNPLPYQAWKVAPDDAAAQQALRDAFPESGTYYVPANANPARDELYLAGPVAFVHLDRDGRPSFVPAQMVKGFVLVAVTVSLIALALRRSLAGLPSYGARAGVAITWGLAAALMIDIGDNVWWFVPIEWKIHQAIYDASAFAIAGLVLAAFLRPESPRI